MRYVIYARQARSGQNGVEEQVTQLTEHAREHNLEVHPVIRKMGSSGTFTGKPRPATDIEEGS